MEAPRSRPVSQPGLATSRTAVWAGQIQTIDIERLIAGRWLNGIGLIAVALGVSYFLKLAIDNDWIGPLGQVALGLLLGASLLASLPWFLSRGDRYFADGMAGLGGAVLYLSLWAGGSYYQLIPLTMAFVLFIAVTGTMLAIALTIGSQRLALLAMVGGFLTPSMVGSSQASQLTLFIYLATLNLVLLPIAWSRAWRWLDVPALLLTQCYFWLWYAAQYRPDRLASTAFFVALFFMIFIGPPVLRATRGAALTSTDTLLVPLNAGLWLLAFVVLLWQDHRWLLTLVTIALALVHLAAASAAGRTAPTGASAAGMLFGGVALTLATLIIPIRLNGAWLTLAWSVEGAVLMWTGLRAGLAPARALAYVLLVVAALRVLNMPAPSSGALVIFNARFIAEAAVVAAIGAAVWMANQRLAALKPVERSIAGALVVAASLLALVALTEEVRLFFGAGAGAATEQRGLAEGLAVSVVWTIYASGLMLAGLRRNIAALRWLALGVIGLTIVKVFANDMSYLSGIYRVASSIALGAVLLAISFFYQRSAKEKRGGVS